MTQAPPQQQRQRLPPKTLPRPLQHPQPPASAVPRLRLQLQRPAAALPALLLQAALQLRAQQQVRRGLLPLLLSGFTLEHM